MSTKAQRTLKRKQWLKSRIKHNGLPVITASSIPILLGMGFNDGLTVEHLLSHVHEKPIVQEETIPMRIGRAMERPILEEINRLPDAKARFCDHHPNNIAHRAIEDVGGKTIGYIGASIDAWIVYKDWEKHILEIKHTSYKVLWNVSLDKLILKDREGIIIPSRIMAQVQAQMLVYGHRMAFIGVLFGASDIRLVRVLACEKWQSVIMNVVVPFLRNDKPFLLMNEQTPSPELVSLKEERGIVRIECSVRGKDVVSMAKSISLSDDVKASVSIQKTAKASFVKIAKQTIEQEKARIAEGQSVEVIINDEEGNPIALIKRTTSYPKGKKKPSYRFSVKNMDRSL